MLKDEYILACVDPSLQQTGLSIIKVSNKKPYNWCDKHIEIIDYCIIPTHGMEHGKALIQFNNIITNYIDKYKPDYVTAEAPFVGSNRDTIQKLANIHGVLQLICAKNNLNLIYYSVLTAKSKTLGGIKLKKEDGTRKSGEEMKEEVAEKIFEIFGKKSFIKEYTLDVTDSLSMGTCFVAMDGKEQEKAKKKRKSKTKVKKEIK